MKSQVATDSRPVGGAFLPVPFCAVLEGPAVAAIDTAERELRRRAATDGNRCAGFFPTLSGVPGIDSDFPSCRDLMRLVPKFEHEGRVYRFNFMRLSLVCQASSARLAHRLRCSDSTDRRGCESSQPADPPPLTEPQRNPGTRRGLPRCRRADSRSGPGRWLHPASEERDGSRQGAECLDPGSGGGDGPRNQLRLESDLSLRPGRRAEGHFVAAYGFELSTSS